MKLRNEPTHLPQKQADLIFVMSEHGSVSQIVNVVVPAYAPGLKSHWKH